MEHNRREGTHNHPCYQTQTAHTPLQTSIIVKVVGRRHYHHSSISQRLPDFTEERPPRKTLPQRLTKPVLADAKQMTLRIGVWQL
jgi:hypothetical protein